MKLAMSSDHTSAQGRKAGGEDRVAERPLFGFPVDVRF